MKACLLTVNSSSTLAIICNSRSGSLASAFSETNTWQFVFFESFSAIFALASAIGVPDILHELPKWFAPIGGIPTERSFNSHFSSPIQIRKLLFIRIIWQYSLRPLRRGNSKFVGLNTHSIASTNQFQNSDYLRVPILQNQKIRNAKKSSFAASLEKKNELQIVYRQARSTYEHGSVCWSMTTQWIVDDESCTNQQYTLHIIRGKFINQKIPLYRTFVN